MRNYILCFTVPYILYPCLEQLPYILYGDDIVNTFSRRKLFFCLILIYLKLVLINNRSASINVLVWHQWRAKSVPEPIAINKHAFTQFCDAYMLPSPPSPNIIKICVFISLYLAKNLAKFVRSVKNETLRVLPKTTTDVSLTI